MFIYVHDMSIVVFMCAVPFQRVMFSSNIILLSN